jgi:hypothetical protein
MMVDSQIEFLQVLPLEFVDNSDNDVDNSGRASSISMIAL